MSVSLKNTLKRAAMYVGVAAVGFSQMGCGGGDDPVNPRPNPEPGTGTNPTNKIELSIGENRRAGYVAYDVSNGLFQIDQSIGANISSIQLKVVPAESAKNAINALGPSLLDPDNINTDKIISGALIILNMKNKDLPFTIEKDGYYIGKGVTKENKNVMVTKASYSGADEFIIVNHDKLKTAKQNADDVVNILKKVKSGDLKLVIDGKEATKNYNNEKVKITIQPVVK